jgi:hypothetical protein
MQVSYISEWSSESVYIPSSVVEPEPEPQELHLFALAEPEP